MVANPTPVTENNDSGTNASTTIIGAAVGFDSVGLDVGVDKEGEMVGASEGFDVAGETVGDDVG